MLEPHYAPKFSQAKSALNQLLTQIPAGTMVSLWTFGQLPDNIPVNAEGHALAPPGREVEFRKLSDDPAAYYPSIAPAPKMGDRSD